MKGIGKFILIFVLFFVGTTAIVHVDRQCAQVNGVDQQIMPAVEKAAENIIEKYASLL